MKKGFTMVELIAIIIILAVISLIAFPTINNMIKKAQITNDKQLVRTIIDEANILYNDYVFKDKQNQLIGKDIYNILTTKDKPGTGSLIINSYGNIKVAIKIEDRCYKKDYDETNIELVDDSLCTN